MNHVLHDLMFDLTVARWDCGPGCGTTGCGNTPEDLRRFIRYQRTGIVPKKPVVGEPGWTPSRIYDFGERPVKPGYWRRLFSALLGRDS